MKHYAVWIDHRHAYLYDFNAETVKESQIKSHSSPTPSKDHSPFYHQVAEALKDAQELFIMGPGKAKDEFKHHLENHPHARLAKAVVGIESMDSHPTASQMKEKARKFFKNYHMWTKNY